MKSRAARAAATEAKVALRKEIQRRMFTHLREAAEALEVGDKEKMRFAEMVLTGMLDLHLRTPEDSRLVKQMVNKLAKTLRGDR